VALLLLLLAANAGALAAFASTLLEEGASVLLLFAAEYGLLLLEALRMAYHYVVVFCVPARRDADRGEEIGRTIRASQGRIAKRPGHHHRHRHIQQQVEEEGGFLQHIRALGDDDALNTCGNRLAKGLGQARNGGKAKIDAGQGAH